LAVLFLDVDLGIFFVYCGDDRSVLGFSTGAGKCVTGVDGVFDWVAASVGKYEVTLGQALALGSCKFAHIGSSSFAVNGEYPIQAGLIGW
jgi:hypothetical protein